MKLKPDGRLLNVQPQQPVHVLLWNLVELYYQEGERSQVVDWAHFVDLRDPIFIFGFRATFKLACNTNRIRVEAAMWGIPFLVKSALATMLNGWMYAATYIRPLVISVNTVEPTTQNNFFAPISS